MGLWEVDVTGLCGGACAVGPRSPLQPHRGGGTGGVGRADAGDRGKAASLTAAWLERVPTCLP